MTANVASVPHHIGYIVDGNRRWAKERSLSTYEGHLAGYETLKEIVRATFDAGVKVVSAYVFSTENWKRTEEEVSKLMSLTLKILTSSLNEFHEQGIRLEILGTRDKLDKKIISAIENAEAKTAQNTKGTLAICFNYGGQLEITEAVKKIVQSGINADDISIETLHRNMYKPEIPALDMLVRTSGEQRISNFMLWRSAYSELMFLDKNWPDMTKEDVSAIIEEYSKRQRRFGG